MIKLAFYAVLLAGRGFAYAAPVDAGEVTPVTVYAPLYDTRVSDDGGCDPIGCVGELTRDENVTDLESRWSCKPELGSAGSTCNISYAFDESFFIDGLSIAMYMGDERTRTMNITVDDDIFTSWTSSGTTLDFESIYIGVNGTSIGLIGVLNDTDWLSIMEVAVMVISGEE